MKVCCRATLAAAMLSGLMLAGCGGGGEGGSVSMTDQSVSMTDQPHTPSTPTLPPPNAANNEYRIHPGLTVSDAKRSPIYRTGNLLRIGVDQGTGLEQLPTIAVPGFPDVQVRYGTIRDGVGASELQSYLSSVHGQYTGLNRRLAGYEVRVIGSPPTDMERRRLLAAVQLVNAALPESAKLSVGTELPDFSLKDTVNDDGRYFGSRREMANTIHVEFIPESEFYSDAAGTSWGKYIQLSRGTFPAYTDERKAVILMAHELIHSLGIDGHVPERFDSIMEAGNRIYDRAQGSRQPASLLYPIDREALRALYGPLRHSTDPNDLGPWAATSKHLVIDNPHGAFGVARRNGYAEPWAYGVAPQTDLASNRALSGSVNWSGVLVGFTPAEQEQRVAGDAVITVNLPTMTGSSAAFNNLVTIGTGGQTSRWGDGDLRYSIAVRGNTFRETGGDDGRLTGIFAGRSHEAAGGTLERSDLTAAFGASRR